MRFDRRPSPLDAVRTQDGMGIRTLSSLAPLLLVALRPIGSVHARTWLRAVARDRRAAEEAGARICLLHQADDALAASEFARYGLEFVARASDPSGALHDHLGLAPGGARGLFGARSWAFSLRGLLREGRRAGPGDRSRSPGLFRIRDGKVEAEFRPLRAADEPPLAKFASPA